MARTELGQLRLIGLDKAALNGITSLVMGLMNGRPTVRHRSGVTEAILAVFDRAGVVVDEDMRIYETAEEAEQHADRLVDEGYKLFMPYPLRAHRFTDEAHLVLPSVYRRLNAKKYLGEIVPRWNLAAREIVSLCALSNREYQRPAFLKAVSEEATGLGYAVRYCADRAQWRAALQWFASADIREVIVEEAMAVYACWCVAIVVQGDRTIYAGAAEQVFDSPAHQTGSVIDKEMPFPEAGEKLAVEVGEAARKAGYAGIAGLDIGLCDDGRLIVFDPNFRLNGSTSQVLLHRSAARRGGFTASGSVNLAVPAPFEHIERIIRGPIDEGWFVPTRLIDGVLCQANGGQSRCTGFVLGKDRAQAMARQQQIWQMLQL
jgi:hypothetical protein